MYIEERLSYILKILEENGRVNVSSLASELKVSEVTIRKDLSVLEEKDYLKRTFGGAVALRPHVKSATLDEKKDENIELKKIIANKCDEFLNDSLDIFLDSGSTTYEIIDKIVAYKDITVVTYDIAIAHKLAKYPHIKTYLLGGYIENNTEVAMSIDGFKTLSRMHADICFIGTDAFDEKCVYSTSDLKASIKRKMIDNSRYRVLVSDSTKFMKEGLFSFYDLLDFDSIISDRQNEKLNRLLDEGAINEEGEWKEY